MPKKKVILVDLDGTLAYYDGWKGPEHIGDPIPVMVRKIKTVIDDGGEVRIFTARASDPNNIPFIENWITEHRLPSMKITNSKGFDATEIWDDRARRVIENTGHFEDGRIE